MIDNNRNFILAIVLSIVVLIGWQFFIAGAADRAGPPAAGDRRRSAPKTRRRQRDHAARRRPAARPAAPAGSRGRADADPRGGAGASRRASPIATGALSGSINLTGGRIDDLRLNDFHETVDPTSPTIVLLSPAAAPDGYFAEFGWMRRRRAGRCPARRRCGRRRPAPSSPPRRR